MHLLDSVGVQVAGEGEKKTMRRKTVVEKEGRGKTLVLTLLPGQGTGRGVI